MTLTDVRSSLSPYSVKISLEMANPVIDGPSDPIPDEIARPAVGLAYDLESGSLVPSHRHSKHQLIYASAGVMRVTTAAGCWVVPPQRAVWVPGGTTHSIEMSGAVAMRTVYLDPAAASALPDTCCVVTVNPLLCELILRCVALVQPYPLGGAEERLIGVLIDEIAAIRVAPLHLPLPRDPRLAHITGALQQDPSDRRSLGEWAREAGASSRTLARLFHRETGLSFGHWRQQLRLLHALERLAGGESVTAVAFSLGYESPSAFIAMFRRSLGQTPGRYFAPVEQTGSRAQGGTGG